MYHVRSQVAFLLMIATTQNSRLNPFQVSIYAVHTWMLTSTFKHQRPNSGRLIPPTLYSRLCVLFNGGAHPANIHGPSLRSRIQPPKRPLRSPRPVARGMLLTTFPILALTSETMIGGEQSFSWRTWGWSTLDASDTVEGADKVHAMLMWKADEKSCG